MNYYHFLTAAVPDMGFSAISFDNFMEQLSSNFLIAMLAVFALFIVSVLMYFAICYLVLLWNQLMGYSNEISQPELILDKQTNK
jgi:membrane-anchored glycerophosphoryl diester phosphodiesterase (GDPDase)